ncbi:MAG: tRNA (cytidine(34)-2'-O)-methyltransferase, partial [Candidatus Binataceae bacterium]
LVDLETYPGWDDFDRIHPTARADNFKYFSARAEKSYLEARYLPGDFLVFGSETRGLGAEFLSSRAHAAYRIPIFEPGVRSLNLANAVAIVVYEALRQTGMIGGAA